MMKRNPALSSLDRIVGSWNVTGSHPMLPGRALPGKVTFEWVEGGAFIRMHSKMEAPEFPEGVAIFGTDSDDDSCSMLYFDDRPMARVYAVTIRQDGFTWSRDSAKFAQRFVVTIAEDGGSMKGDGTMKKEGGSWEPDLCLLYARAETH